MPFVRLLLRLRLISVFRGWDKLLRICFEPDREPEASLEFSVDGVRDPGLTPIFWLTGAPSSMEPTKKSVAGVLPVASPVIG